MVEPSQTPPSPPQAPTPPEAPQNLATAEAQSGSPQVQTQPPSAQQRLESLRRVQAQADQRVKLGYQLFKAAEAKIASHQSFAQQIQAGQDALREQVQEDVAKTLQGYDQWVGQMDENFTRSLRGLQDRLDALEARMDREQGQVQQMVQRAEALLDQARVMTDDGKPARRRGREAKAEAKAKDAGSSARPASQASRSSSDDSTEGGFYQDILRRLRSEDEDDSAAA